MASLPQPGDLMSLVLRTDVTDEATWDALRAAIDNSDQYPSATYVSEPEYAGVTLQSLIDTEAAAADQGKLTFLLLADATTMTDDEHPLLAIDLYAEPGRTFRLPPHWYPDACANLGIANMDFAEVADATGESGTFRGFDGP